MSEAFVAFYERCYPLMLTVARQRLSGTADAEDVVADVFRVTWGHYQETGDLSMPWVYQTLRNRIGNEYRRRDRAPLLTDSELPGGVSDEITARADAITVRAAMNALEPDDRELLFMAYWEDLTASEIGEILDCTATTIRVRLFRARRRLQQRLDDSFEQGKEAP